MRLFARTLKQVIGPQISKAAGGDRLDLFQAGYAEALCWSWQQAGLPTTPELITLRAMIMAVVMSDEGERT